MGLLAGAQDDWEWRTAVAEALHGFDNDGCARLLFCELRTVKGSNTTRRYRDAVLKSLATLPAGLTSAGFEAMLEDPTCSQRTRDKVRCILDGVEVANRHRPELFAPHIRIRSSPMHVHRMPVNTGPVSYTYAPSLI